MPLGRSGHGLIAKQGWGFPAELSQRNCSDVRDLDHKAGLRSRPASRPTGVDEENRVIIAVLSVHPDGTAYAKATKNLTALVRALAIPGATPLT